MFNVKLTEPARPEGPSSRKQHALKGQKLTQAARPEGAEALSPGQRPGFVGVSLTPCKGKSFKKHLIKNENSLRYVKLLPLLLYLHLEK